MTFTQKLRILENIIWLFLEKINGKCMSLFTSKILLHPILKSAMLVKEPVSVEKRHIYSAVSLLLPVHKLLTLRSLALKCKWQFAKLNTGFSCINLYNFRGIPKCGGKLVSQDVIYYCNVRYDCKFAGRNWTSQKISQVRRRSLLFALFEDADSTAKLPLNMHSCEFK